jgi:lysophospholipase L1-like esterase
MWGEGSRDDYTIPSQVARLLNGSGTPVRASNYGQIAYVSTQDEILFERQLALGNVPDTAVFYGGFNDLASVYIHEGTAGLPHNEINRQRDLISGQILRDGRPLISQPGVNFSDLDFSLVAVADATPAQIVDLYLANLRLIRAAGREFGVETLFVWQPAILYKQQLTPQEQLFVDENRIAWAGFDELYQAVDEELRRRIATDGIEDILMLSDLFADESRYLFYDRVHVIEDANTLIAEAIAPALLPLLNAEEA